MNRAADVAAAVQFAREHDLLTCHQGRRAQLARVEPALCDALIRHAAAISSPHSAIVLFQLGGALNRMEPGHTPVGNRDARYVFNVTAAWDAAQDDAAQVRWARDAWTDLKGFSTGGTYLNTEQEGPDRTRAALGGAWQRLAEVKRAWDPHSVFRANRNVAPALAAGGEQMGQP